MGGRKRRLDEDPSDTPDNGTIRDRGDVEDIWNEKPRRDREVNVTKEVGSRGPETNQEQRMAAKTKSENTKRCNNEEAKTKGGNSATRCSNAVSNTKSTNNTKRSNAAATRTK